MAKKASKKEKSQTNSGTNKISWGKNVVIIVLLIAVVWLYMRDDRRESSTVETSLDTPISSARRVSGVLLPDSKKTTLVTAPINDESADETPLITTTSLPNVSSLNATETPFVTESARYRPLDITAWFNQPHTNAYPEANEGYARWFTIEDQTFGGIPFFVKIGGSDIAAFGPRDRVVSRSVQIPGRTLRGIYVLYGCGWCGTGTQATMRITTEDDRVIEKRFEVQEWSEGSNPVAMLGSNQHSFSGNLYVANVNLEITRAETFTIIDDTSGPQLAIAAVTVQY